VTRLPRPLCRNLHEIWDCTMLFVFFTCVYPYWRTSTFTGTPATAVATDTNVVAAEKCGVVDRRALADFPPTVQAFPTFLAVVDSFKWGMYATSCQAKTTNLSNTATKLRGVSYRNTIFLYRMRSGSRRADRIFLMVVKRMRWASAWCIYRSASRQCHHAQMGRDDVPI
jgi:hypothetical protein